MTIQTKREACVEQLPGYPYHQGCPSAEDYREISIKALINQERYIKKPVPVRLQLSTTQKILIGVIKNIGEKTMLALTDLHDEDTGTSILTIGRMYTRRTLSEDALFDEYAKNQHDLPRPRAIIRTDNKNAKKEERYYDPYYDKNDYRQINTTKYPDLLEKINNIDRMSQPKGISIGGKPVKIIR